MGIDDTLKAVWRQLLVEEREAVQVGSESYSIGRTRARGLRTVAFVADGVRWEGIEQNPEKDSRWGQLARDGHRILQFSVGRRYVANVCDAVLTRYPAWRSLHLPE